MHAIALLVLRAAGAMAPRSYRSKTSDVDKFKHLPNLQHWERTKGEFRSYFHFCIIKKGCETAPSSVSSRMRRLDGS